MAALRVYVILGTYSLVSSDKIDFAVETVENETFEQSYI